MSAGAVWQSDGNLQPWAWVSPFTVASGDELKLSGLHDEHFSHLSHSTGHNLHLNRMLAIPMHAEGEETYSEPGNGRTHL